MDQVKQEVRVVYGNDVKKMIQARADYLQTLIDEKQIMLKDAPEGKLRISKDKKRVRYYLRREKQDRRGSYIPDKKEELARLLAQKNYDEKVLSAAEKESRILQNVLKWYQGNTADDIFGNMSVYRQQIITPVEDTDEVFVQKWIERKFTGKGFAPNDPELITNRGERVRSKSELIIANLLAQEKIPYRYEYPLVLHGMGTVHPDFIILNVRQRKEWIWEHQGRMDDPVYAEHAVKKVQSYILNGYYPGEKLILTAETSQRPLNINILKTMIQRYCK